jgi:SAM-dependent methyltransferase
MEETRDLWNAWSDDFQGAWEAETNDDELPPAPIHFGPGFPEDERLDFLPDLDETDVLELGCGGGQASVGFAREGVNRIVGEIHEALVDAGFVVERLREPGSDDPEIYREQWSHDPDLMALIPPTLVARATLAAD